MFFLAIDPGAQRNYTPPAPRNPNTPPPGRSGPIASPIGSKASTQASDSIECYGPLGESDDPTKRPGPPLESAGSFMSTNLASWCIIPPNESQPFFGFYLRGPSGTKGYVKKKVAPALVNLISTLSGRSLVSTDFGIYNGDVLASRSVSATDDGGLLINVALVFSSTSTLISPNLSPKVSRRRTASERATTTSAVDKVVTASEAESLSIAPNDFSVNGSRAALYGFVTDAGDLIGKTVTIKKQVGSKYRAVGRAKVKEDGSYSLRIPVTEFQIQIPLVQSSLAQRRPTPKSPSLPASLPVKAGIAPPYVAVSDAECT